MLADALRTTPAGVGETLALVDGLDDALVHGLARLDEDRTAALEDLAAAFAGSPLADRVADSVGKIIAGSVTDEHLIALAGARTALLGAVHDALLTSVDTALGRTRQPWAATTPETTPGLLAGGRSWLRELAIAGWHGVDHELAAAGGQAVAALLADPAQRRLAVLLDGFAGELRAAAPVATLDRIPVRRWADLWTRALLLSQDDYPAFEAAPVSGRLLYLGVDLHEHPTVFQAQVHALLETGGEVRVVRTGVAAAKVDTITGPSVWRMLAGFPVFRAMVTGGTSAEIDGMALTPAGDLIWDEARATSGDAADPITTARVRLGAATLPAVPPLDRHPAMLTTPVLLEGFDLGGGVMVAVDYDRLPAAGPLTPALVDGSTACLGLLRWDGRWSVQPLAVQATVKKKQVTVHSGEWALGPTEAKAAKAEATAGTAVDVLRERAGRLLRK
ncbi:hypothetical protein J2S43_003268 [Catenuloplanes nepalensis]|uniref:Uncharacterized protein n=1 Tax=Catenuloplanes nepalensis TaxID=587533 RepID=A0ABT9MTJ1_9ACTN|nr:hypothetical protein [Catenuloplanes nepalensis]MDP9794756.1 hypothetical protein [Catenuloplanes nepalensis]